MHLPIENPLHEIPGIRHCRRLIHGELDKIFDAHLFECKALFFPRHELTALSRSVTEENGRRRVKRKNCRSQSVCFLSSADIEKSPVTDMNPVKLSDGRCRRNGNLKLIRAADKYHSLSAVKSLFILNASPEY